MGCECRICIPAPGATQLDNAGEPRLSECYYQPATTTNYIHEIAGAFRLNFFPHSPRFSIFTSLGANVYLEHYYDSYSASRLSNSGLAPSVKIGLAYNLRK